MTKAPIHDFVIIGGGPAALSASLYACRLGLETVVYEQEKIGGTLTEISQIENYPGFSGTGIELAEAMRSQAGQFGAKIAYGECADIIRLPNGQFELTVDAEPVVAKTVLIATGSAPRRLPFSLQVPVSYCALCDGVLARGRKVAVVGGANAAFQESLYLATLAKDLTIITHSTVKADRELQDRLKNLPNVKVLENLEPTPDLLNDFDYVFVYIGREPATKFLARLNPESLLDPAGYIIAPDQSTAIQGLFAGGDVRSGAVRQVVTAVADGARAALLASAYLQKRP